MKLLSQINHLIILFLLLSSCSDDTIYVSNEVTTKDYEFTDFTSLEVNDNFKVYLTFSDTEEKLKVEANENLHSYIRLIQEGEKLIIKIHDIPRIKGQEVLNIYIATKTIKKFNLVGNSKLNLENTLNTNELTINLTGNSFFTGPINSEKVKLTSKGNCMIDLSGKVNYLDANLTGNCEFSNYNLKIEKLKINFSGNSNAYLTVNDEISIDAAGNSTLFYKGNANIVHQNLHSNSQIIKK